MGDREPEAWQFPSKAVMWKVLLTIICLCFAQKELRGALASFNSAIWYSLLTCFLLLYWRGTRGAAVGLNLMLWVSSPHSLPELCFWVLLFLIPCLLTQNPRKNCWSNSRHQNSVVKWIYKYTIPPCYMRLVSVEDHYVRTYGSFYASENGLHTGS